MSSIDQINREIIALWKEQNFPDSQEVFMPLIYPPLKSGVTVLFVGLNPSFGEHWGWLKKTKYRDFDADDRKEFFVWKNFLQRKCEDQDLARAQEIDGLARQHYRFYQAYSRFVDELGINGNWEHIDLFFYRMTNQNEFKKVIRDGKK